MLRAVEKTRGVQGVQGVAQTNNQSMQTDELPPAYPAGNGALETAALPDPVQVLSRSFFLVTFRALFFLVTFIRYTIYIYIVYYILVLGH